MKFLWREKEKKETAIETSLATWKDVGMGKMLSRKWSLKTWEGHPPSLCE